MSRNSESKFQVILSSTKSMFHYMTPPPFKRFRAAEKGPSSGWRNPAKFVIGSDCNAKVELMKKQNEREDFPN